MTKLRQATWPRFIDVRLNTFGLYLVHPLCIFLLCHAFDVIYRFVMNASPGSLLQNSVQFWACLPVAVGMWATMFVLCYGMSLVIVQMLVARSALSWMVGQPASNLPVRMDRPQFTLARKFAIPAIHAEVQVERN